MFVYSGIRGHGVQLVVDVGAHAGHRHVPTACCYNCTYLYQQCHLSSVQAL